MNVELEQRDDVSVASKDDNKCDDDDDDGMTWRVKKLRLLIWKQHDHNANCFGL